MTLARPIPPSVLADAAQNIFGKIKRGDGCWEFRGNRSPKGYGQFYSCGKKWPAHRLVFAVTARTPAPCEVVRHKCDNPPCCNPSHLEAGSQLDNARDRVLRGREPDRSGENNGRAKLSSSDVARIRASGFGSKRLAKIYNVGRTTIRDIKARKTWGASK